MFMENLYPLLFVLNNGKPKFGGFMGLNPDCSRSCPRSEIKPSVAPRDLNFSGSFTS